jgi:hypothetical protein
MTLSVGIALALSTALSANASAVETRIAPVMPVSQTVEGYVREYFADIPEMIAVAECESRFRQFDKDGKVIKNPGSTAIGVMQIMASLHTEPAQKLGLDITTVEGNLGYARYLYEKQGIRPWNASKKCWESKLSPHLAVANN